jgi:hypothetical protein
MSNIGIAYKFAYNLSPCNKISAVSPSQPDIQQLKLRALRLPLAAFHLCPWQLLMCFSQDAKTASLANPRYVLDENGVSDKHQ